MQTIRTRFKKITNKNPLRASANCFAEAVLGQGYSERTVRFWFHRLVDKDDYAAEDEREVVSDMVVKNFTPKLVPKSK